MDRVQLQYQLMTANAEILCSLKDFSFYHDSLDKLYFSLIGSSEQYTDLWSVVKMVLVLSHGNASVESGFSINNDVLVENLQLESMIAQRIVYDSVKAAGGISKIEINKQLLLSFRAARSRYSTYLDEKRKLDETEAQRKDRLKRAAAELKELKAKKQRLMEKSQAELALMDSEIRQLEKASRQVQDL